MMYSHSYTYLEDSGKEYVSTDRKAGQDFGWAVFTPQKDHPPEGELR